MWLSSRLPGAGTHGQGAGRGAGGVPTLAGAGEGGSGRGAPAAGAHAPAPANPRRSLPAHQPAPLPMLRPAAQSHFEDEEFGNSPAAPPPRAACPPDSPLTPAGGRQRGIFRAVLSLRIRALSIGSRRSRSNQHCIKEGAPRDNAVLARRGERRVLPRPPLMGRRAQALIPAQVRQAQPAPRAVHGQARCAFCQSPGDAGETAELQACPGGNGGASRSAVVLGCGGLLQQELGRRSCPRILASGPAVELGGRPSPSTPRLTAPASPQPHRRQANPNRTDSSFPQRRSDPRTQGMAMSNKPQNLLGHEAASCGQPGCRLRSPVPASTGTR